MPNMILKRYLLLHVFVLISVYMVVFLLQLFLVFVYNLYAAYLFYAIVMNFLLAESANFTICITVPTPEEYSQ